MNQQLMMDEQPVSDGRSEGVRKRLADEAFADEVRIQNQQGETPTRFPLDRSSDLLHETTGELAIPQGVDEGGAALYDAEEQLQYSEVPGSDVELDNGEQNRGKDASAAGSESTEEEDEEDRIAADDEEDLFTSTFGETIPAHGESLEEEGDEAEQPRDNIVRTATTPPPSKRSATLNLSVGHDYASNDVHTRGCPPYGGPSTPPTSPIVSTRKKLSANTCTAPDPVRDASSHLKRYKSFHTRSVQLVPRMPLAPHRYWIGVLNIGVKPANIGKEKDFTWFKGNRLTTVETVWNAMMATTAEEEFVLLLGHDKVGMEETAQEMDYSGDRKVFFRAVRPDHPDAKGWAMGWEAGIAEEDRSIMEGDEGKKGKAKVKAKSNETIVID